MHMAGRPLVYAYEDISDALPRPPMAALRALLSSGILVSPRAWHELTPEIRRQFAYAGAEEQVDPEAMTKLLRQIPVSQVKFIGKTPDPSAEEIPAALVAALGPVRPLTLAEWRGLRALDRYVLATLAANTRLLRKALGEILPQAAFGKGVANAWSGEVARSELRLRREVLQAVLTPEFMAGRAFVLANVAGRRAARRASEVLDEHAESTVGHVEVAWGLRPTDDVIFWQAHVSAWDGTFFPAAALLATTAAAVAMYDMVKDRDPEATISCAGIRAEPWQAGRDEEPEAATALYASAGQPTVRSADPNSAQTVIQSAPPSMPDWSADRASGAPRRTVPMAPSSSPVPFSAAMRNGDGSGVPSSSPSPRPVAARGGDARQASSSRLTVPTWVGVTVVALAVLANLLVILGITVFLTHRP
jgi:molybdenum cofactor biosynthesis enzyme